MVNKWDLIGNIHSSNYRLKVLKSVEKEPKTPRIIEREVEIEKGIAEVKIEIGDAETEFILESTDQEVVLQEIASRLGVSVEDVRPFTKFDIGEEEKDEEAECVVDADCKEDEFCDKGECEELEEEDEDKENNDIDNEDDD